jgi:hypothetical protein
MDQRQKRRIAWLVTAFVIYDLPQWLDSVLDLSERHLAIHVPKFEVTSDHVTLAFRIAAGLILLMLVVGQKPAAKVATILRQLRLTTIRFLFRRDIDITGGGVWELTNVSREPLFAVRLFVMGIDRWVKETQYEPDRAFSDPSHPFLETELQIEPNTPLPWTGNNLLPGASLHFHFAAFPGSVFYFLAKQTQAAYFANKSAWPPNPNFAISGSSTGIHRVAVRMESKDRSVIAYVYVLSGLAHAADTVRLHMEIVAMSPSSRLDMDEVFKRVTKRLAS